MREENYFKKKLEVSKDTLTMAENQLEHLDVQIKLLEKRFEHDKKVYNDQTIHMQKIVANMEKRIPGLEKKIAQGYTTIDMRTGKDFKSFTDRHKGLLKDKIKATEEQQKVIAEKYAQRQALKKKKRDKLTPIELDIVKAQEVREEAQPADELKGVREKEIERLKLKEEFYRMELEKLKTQKKIEKVKEEEKESVVIEELVGEPILPEEMEAEIQGKINLEAIKQIEGKDPHEGKVQCPECKEWFTKGGAFARHYQSHFNGD